MKTWLNKWQPENEDFWKFEGSAHANRTLWITTFSLIFSFATWFVISAVVVRLPNIGFSFDTMQLFWLTAMPGLAGGTFRFIHTFLIPIYGTRHTITISTFLKIIPMIWLGIAVQDLSTPYSHFLLISILCGFGGGDFSSYMPSTSLHFPKKLQGYAMGIQAGIGNFGVSLTQFVTPWIIGLATLGTLTGNTQTFKKGEVVKDIWLQNSAYWYIPFLIIAGILCWLYLRSIRIEKPSIGGMLKNMTDNKHTWFCVITYMMTFGSFSGFSAAFPLMIKTIYGGFEGAPDPLKYAFYGPLIGSLIRAIMGKSSDKLGGSFWLMISGIGLIAGSLLLIFGGFLTPVSLDKFSGFVWVMLFIFLMAGIGNAATFRQYPIVFAFSPRQGAQILGWTGAWAAYGPFIFSSLIGAAITSYGNAKIFFWGALIFYAIATWLNWHYYTRKGAERYDWGTKGGTWWDKAKDTWGK
ncbi:MAG: MFS transporter [Bacteroidetes bacterium RIFCSPLOWO2_02_FULL_36_8]|nr:MAG: MFS transporter [Bacteroidetes bacterium RIFCSPLOWO2_02_FULL_36_8]OFY70848.1 MAG: MFS transporter [Bacteroidetes bacterium RIFCSPLOWO2_12_FULL_37_12]